MIRALTTALLLGAATTSFAHAQAGGPEADLEARPQDRVEASGWRVTVGAAAIWRPEWDGAPDNDWLVVPDLDVRYGERFFASVRTGLGWNAVLSDRWRAGPYVKVRFAREEEDDAALRGLGHVDATPEVGGFVEYNFAFLRASAEVRQGLGGHEGLIAEAGADLRARISDGVFASIGPRVRWAGEEYMQSYYGVDARQAARSGLPVFAASGGVERIDLAAALVARPSPRSTVTVFASTGSLQGDAAGSPLVRRRGDDRQTAVGVSYGFRLIGD